MKLTLIVPCALTPRKYFQPCMERVKEETNDSDEWEVIISEDGEVPQEMRDLYPSWAVVIQHEKSGCGLARKRAMEIATGEWMCFLDSDDLMARGYHKIVSDAVCANPDKYAVEFNFTNVYPKSPIIVMTDEMHQEDMTKTTYGNFSHEMVWNKAYRTDKCKEILDEYNPPLFMTPGEDLLWNTIFNCYYSDKYGHDHHLLLDRIVRDNGSAHSTAADHRNRIATLNISLDAANKINSYAPVVTWIKTYIRELEKELGDATRHLSGMAWETYKRGDKHPFESHQVDTPVTFTLLNKCNEECSYCCNDTAVKLREEPWPDFDEIASKFEEYLDKLIEKRPETIAVNLTGGECTVIGYERLAPIFERHRDIVFDMFTNGSCLDERWLAIPNVYYRVHCVHNTPHISWLFNKHVKNIIWINEHKDSALEEYWLRLKAMFPKVELVEEMSTRMPNTEKEIDLCRRVEGVITVDVEGGFVTPCCGWRQKHMDVGSIDSLPSKLNNDCAGCVNAGDNMYVIGDY